MQPAVEAQRKVKTTLSPSRDHRGGPDAAQIRQALAANQRSQEGKLDGSFDQRLINKTAFLYTSVPKTFTLDRHSSSSSFTHSSGNAYMSKEPFLCFLPLRDPSLSQLLCSFCTFVNNSMILAAFWTFALVACRVGLADQRSAEYGIWQAA